MRNIFIGLIFLFIGSSLFFFSGCKKPLIFSNGNLNFSQDTIVFDTVFTTVGSTTKRLKLYNNENRTVNIEQIELMGGESSPFRINVDGVPGQYFGSTEIEGNDSLYVFIEVTLDPNNGFNPLIIEDSIRFRTNGVDQFVNLAAWGQDAYFHNNDTSSGTWPNDKPHVIYGYAAVDSAQSLTIPAGTNIYLHKNALLINYKGTLNIEGTKDMPVTLQGDRLEADYDDVAGQYYGIYFQEARPSKINYCTIKNGTAGIHLFSEDPANGASNTLEITNSTITNCARYGVFIFAGAKVKAENCMISHNDFHALFLLQNGNFDFNHCHLVGYANGGSQTPVIAVRNYYTDPVAAITNVGEIGLGKITNSVIYGNLEQEIVMDTLSDPAINHNFQIHNNVIRYEDIPNESFYSGNIWNQDPLFVDPDDGDFLFYSTSPLDSSANLMYGNIIPEAIGIDMCGTPRDPSNPDIGAIEFQ